MERGKKLQKGLKPSMNPGQRDGAVDALALNLKRKDTKKEREHRTGQPDSQTVYNTKGTRALT